MKYRITMNVGKAKYLVSYHDGQKTHNDGSPFFDISIFKNQRTMKQFIRELESLGYSAQ